MKAPKTPRSAPSFSPVSAFSVDEYVRVLGAAEGSLSEAHREMLRVQYEAPERAVTSTKLAAAVGYDGYSAANLQYGKLGRLVAEALGASPPDRGPDKGMWWPFLSSGIGSIAARDFRWVMHPELAEALERLGWVDPAASALPEEVAEPTSAALREGGTRSVRINAYERSATARRRCIDHYGPRCAVCGLDLEERYGTVGRGYIHVHHEVPLASMGEEYEVDPLADLKPVCPNCHAVIHRRTPPYSISDVRAMLR